MQGGISLAVGRLHAHPCKSRWLCPWCGSWFPARGWGDRSQRESARAAGSLLRSHGESMEGCGCRLLAQPPRRETEAAPVASQMRRAGLHGNAVISLQMSGGESCCENNISPDMRYIICNEAMRAAAEQDMLSGREGSDSGNSISSPNGRLRQGAPLRGWSLGQKPGCSNAAVGPPGLGKQCNRPHGRSTGEGESTQSLFWGLQGSVGANWAPTVLIWDSVFERYCG